MESSSYRVMEDQDGPLSVEQMMDWIIAIDILNKGRKRKHKLFLEERERLVKAILAHPVKNS